MADKKKETQEEQEQTKYTEEELIEQIAELQTALEKSNTELAEHKTKANQYLSTASYYKNEAESAKKDYERFKERNKNIEEEAKTKAIEDVVKKLLPILDNFDQAIAHVDDGVMKGFAMIHSSLVACLAEFDVVEVETEGTLNPELHNCISTEDTDNESLDETIASVYQKGYKFAGSNKVIRPATVSVYKK